jgi:hypothetical protein
MSFSPPKANLPPPPLPPPPLEITDSESERLARAREGLERKRRGRSSLVVNPAVGGAETGSGIRIP